MVRLLQSIGWNSDCLWCLLDYSPERNTSWTSYDMMLCWVRRLEKTDTLITRRRTSLLFSLSPTVLTWHDRHTNAIFQIFPGAGGQAGGPFFENYNISNNQGIKAWNLIEQSTCSVAASDKNENNKVSYLGWVWSSPDQYVTVRSPLLQVYWFALCPNPTRQTHQ